MQVVFRVDSSVDIGLGHLMRCLTLANALKKEGATVSFVTRELPGNSIGLIEKPGFNVFRLPYKKQNLNNLSLYQQWLGEEIERERTQSLAVIKSLGELNWLVVDHYALDKSWETLIRPFVRRIMVIDDLANRRHNCDLLLDQNYYVSMDDRYIGILPDKCHLLLGPKYALLRNEFNIARQKISIKDGNIAQLLVFFGGVDLSNQTIKTLNVINGLSRRNDISTDVVVGSANPNKSTIKAFCHENPSFQYFEQIDDISRLMSKADLSIGAAGSSTWERACLGLPSITMSLENNQEELAMAAGEVGIVKHLGQAHGVGSEALEDAINKCLDNPGMMASMSQKAFNFVDGLGCNRVVNKLLETV